MRTWQTRPDGCPQPPGVKIQGWANRSLARAGRTRWPHAWRFVSPRSSAVAVHDKPVRPDPDQPHLEATAILPGAAIALGWVALSAAWVQFLWKTPALALDRAVPASTAILLRAGAQWTLSRRSPGRESTSITCGHCEHPRSNARVDAIQRGLESPAAGDGRLSPGSSLRR